MLRFPPVLGFGPEVAENLQNGARWKSRRVEFGRLSVRSFYLGQLAVVRWVQLGLFCLNSWKITGHIVVEPHMFLQPQVLNEFGEDYMFLTCIKYINSVKTGPFAEHSNQLWSISGVSSWQKINGGLIKMYKAEVSKLFCGRVVGC